MGTSEVGWVLSIYTIGVLCVRPFSGYLVDCFSRKALYLFAFTIFAGLFVGYWLTLQSKIVHLWKEKVLHAVWPGQSCVPLFFLWLRVLTIWTSHACRTVYCLPQKFRMPGLLLQPPEQPSRARLFP